MKNIPAFLILALLFFSSCRQENTKSYISIPQDSIIGQSEMISILADVHVIEAGLQIERSKGVDAQKLSAKYYAALYSKFRISEKRFRASMDYYKQDQGKFIRMYDEVIAELEKRSENLKSDTTEAPEE
jgi:hypothetical protein